MSQNNRGKLLHKLLIISSPGDKRKKNLGQNSWWFQAHVKQNIFLHFLTKVIKMFVLQDTEKYLNFN